jgi:uncharacterized protein (DUF1330 family)
MSAYFVLTQTIDNLDEYRQSYIPKIFPILMKHGDEFLVADFAAKPLEGEPAKGAVVIRFSFKQAILDFENDPEYQPAKKIRHDLTPNANAVMADKFKLPF